MADNTYVNKVEYEGQTLMDLTGDTVTPSDVLSGVSFHDRSGAAQQGSLITHNVYDGLDSTSTSDALSANQGKILNEGKVNGGQKYSLTNAGTTNITLPKYMAFILQIYRPMASSSSNNGLYIGYCHNTSSLRPVLESALVESISISGQTLTITTKSGTSSVGATIYYSKVD